MVIYTIGIIGISPSAAAGIIITKYTITLHEIIERNSENIKYAGLYSDKLLQSNKTIKIYDKTIYTAIKNTFPFNTYGNLNKTLYE
jgi:hypothetical protein